MRPQIHNSGKPMDYSDLDERFTPYVENESVST